MTNSPTPFLSAALAAARRGWPVFPVRAGNKCPALHGYDSCPHTGICAESHQKWEQRATTDPDRIRAAWSAGAFNIGVATGPAGLVVIDLDQPKGPDDQPPPPWNQPGVTTGEDVFAVLCERAGHRVPYDTHTVITPRGGVHLYYQAPAGVQLRNTGGDTGRGLGWHIDTRAHGGYVLAPGSTVGTGTYRLLDDRDPAPLPGWIVERLRPTPLPPPARPVPVTSSRRARYLQAAIDAETDKVTSAPPGQRNAALYAAAVALGQLAAGGALTESDVTDTLLRAAHKHIGIGAYSARQAAQTITSGLRTGANRPRQVAA